MQNIFTRYEKKYLVTREQYTMIRDLLSRHMEPDRYGEYLVQNLYYDTENWDVICASVESPLYKEKMRLRCYGIPNQEAAFFLELKKKYKGVVYKRRIAFPSKTLSDKSVREIAADDGSQIAGELDFYMKSNAVSEKIYISYRRAAFIGIADEGLRITFDTDMRFRLNCLDFTCPDNGKIILPQNKVLMEVKTFGGMPIWLAHSLSENAIFPTPYSKYGVCYTDYILKNAGTESVVRISA